MAYENPRESILEFLNSPSSRRKRIARCRCGLVMEHQNLTFFYEGQNWGVDLPICRECHPAPSVPILYDA